MTQIFFFIIIRIKVILYNILNRNEKIYCERIFAPAEDMEALMREEGRKLFTLETFTPVDELDIVGFTLQYELSYTNVLNILDLSGMPLHSADRGEEFPVIVCMDSKGTDLYETAAEKYREEFV